MSHKPSKKQWKNHQKLIEISAVGHVIQGSGEHHPCSGSGTMANMQKTHRRYAGPFHFFPS